MIDEIRNAVRARGITRLCHFTPSRNLPHIVGEETGILCTKSLTENEQAVFTATDHERIDGYEDRVCCSIQYPNAWYLRRAREKERLFLDWVIIFIDPSYLALEGTGFCARNAAAGSGRFVGFGLDAFNGLFAQSVIGARGIIRTRENCLFPTCPTDDQAEILVPDRISFAHIIGVAVRNENQARNEVARLQLAGLPSDSFEFVVAPDLFNPYSLSNAIHAGRHPGETVWVPN
jgi:hypothetical protein